MTNNSPVFQHPFEEGFYPPMQTPSQKQEECCSKRPRFSNSPPMNMPHNPKLNPSSLIFFKTRPCKMFNQGSCPHGQNCTFAHGPEDLRQPPPNWQEFITKDLSFTDKNNTLYGGERFFHVDNSSGYNNGKRSMFWKTKLCHKFEKFGHCTFGDYCQYAHGLAELKKFGADADKRTTSFEVIPSECPPEVTHAAATLSKITHAATLVEENKQESTRNFKWPKKLIGIYADDWIDYC